MQPGPPTTVSFKPNEFSGNHLMKVAFCTIGAITIVLYMWAPGVFEPPEFKPGWLTELLNNHRAIVFTDTRDRYTSQACMILADGLGLPPHTVPMDEAHGYTFSRVQELKALTKRTTFPQIFIDGQPIGGYSDLYQLYISGALHRRTDLPVPKGGVPRPENLPFGGDIRIHGGNKRERAM